MTQEGTLTSPSGPAFTWSDRMVGEDIRAVLVAEGFEAQWSPWDDILAIASGGVSWELYLEVVRSPRCLSVALVAVSDSWASNEDSAEKVRRQLIRAAHAYSTARAIEVLVAPVPHW
jgi:hypothetical protein